MLNIPESVKTLFKTDGTHKNFRVQFPNGEFPDITNDNIVRESLHFTESLCSQSVFKFGLAEASVLEFETVGIGNMYGMTINASIEIDLSSLTAAEIADIEAGTWDGEYVALADSDLGFPFFRVPLGVFRVEKCPRNHGAMTHRQVEAYSADQVETTPDGTIPGFPSQLPFYSSIKADVSGVLSAGSGDGLTKIGEATFGASSPTVPNLLYDSAANSYELGLRVNGTLSRPREYSLSAPSSSHIDFLRAGDFDAEAYYAQGMAIAAAIDDLDLDLTYNARGNKIYATNAEALYAILPYWFVPSLLIEVTKNGNNLKHSDELIGKLEPQSLTPVLWPETVAGASYADNALFRMSGADLSSVAIYVRCIDASGINSLTLQLAQTGGAVYTPDVSVVYHDAVPTVELLQGAASGMILNIKNSGALQAKRGVWMNMTSSAVTTETFKMWSFVNSVDYPKLVNGCYELKGQFAKTDRIGGLETVALSPTPYISMGPGDYDEVWWDEYNVAPIGSVVVTVNDQNKNNTQNTPTSINIGSGASIYDMSDNAAMEMLEANTVSQIRALLRGEFKTNATHAGFTPIDLSVQGWPWLEAGDALRITAEDGTVVNTYALRVEMDGVQHLMSTITAEGGEIVGET